LFLNIGTHTTVQDVSAQIFYVADWW